MERRVQTRHSTGAVCERRVWNFSSKRQKSSEETDHDSAKRLKKQQLENSLQDNEKALRKRKLDSSKKANNEEVKTNLQNTENALRYNRQKCEKGIVTKDCQQIPENLGHNTVQTRQKLKTKRSTQIDFDASEASGHIDVASRKDTKQLKGIKQRVKTVPIEKLTSKETVKTRLNKQPLENADEAIKKKIEQSIPESDCTAEKVVNSIEVKQDYSRHETRLDEDSSPRLILEEEINQDNTVQDSLKVVIPVGEENSLNTEVNEMLMKSTEKVTKYSLRAKHVSVVPGEIMEVDGERLVKLPNCTEDDYIIIVAVGGKKKVVDEIVKKNGILGTVQAEDNRVNVALCSEQKNDNNGTMTLKEDPRVANEKHTQTISDSELEDLMENDHTSENFNKRLVDCSINVDPMVKKKNGNAEEKSSKEDDSTRKERCDLLEDLKEDGTSANYIGDNTDYEWPPEQLICNEEIEDMEVGQSDGVSEKKVGKNNVVKVIKFSQSDTAKVVKANQGDVEKDKTFSQSKVVKDKKVGQIVEVIMNNSQGVVELDKKNHEWENVQDKKKSQTEVVTDKNVSQTGVPVGKLVPNNINKNSENPIQQKDGALKLSTKRHDKQDRNHQCRYCGKKFQYNRDLQIHLRTHTGDRPYSCTYCDKRFTQKSVLTNHERTHTGEKPYVCAFCGKAFSDPSSLRVHTRYHTGERPYKCNFCEKSFANGTHYKDHLTKHTGEKKFVCHLCGKAFRTSELFNSHYRVHTGEKRYACKVCGKRFHSSRNRRRHMPMHTGIKKRFMCDICGKNIISSTNFTKHKKLHLTDKPFVCDICDQPFRDKKCYKNHLQAHTDRVPHVCPECGKSFVMLSHMKRHVVTHKENTARLVEEANARKPYACNFCDKRYKDKQCFKKHYLQHPEAQNVIFKCVICEKQFSTLAFLEEHVTTHENLETNEVVYITSDDVDKVFSCGICEENFEGIKNFEEHLQIHSEGVALVQSDLIEGDVRNIEQDQIAGAVNEEMMMMIKEECANRMEGVQQEEHTKYTEQTEECNLSSEMDHDRPHPDLEEDPENNADQKNQQVEYINEVDHVLGCVVQGKNENEVVESVNHVGATLENFEHLGQVEHIEQVITEDGQSVQTIVYVTVGEEEMKTLE